MDIMKVDWRCRQKGGTESYRLNRNTWKKRVFCFCSKIILAGKWRMGWAREEVKDVREEETVTWDGDDKG